MVFVCLCGNEEKDVIKKYGIEIANKMAEEGIKKIPNELIKAINRYVGFRLLTKYGEKGVINLCKWVPVAGGLVGAAFDGVFNHTVGKVARERFIGNA